MNRKRFWDYWVNNFGVVYSDFLDSGSFLPIPSSARSTSKGTAKTVVLDLSDDMSLMKFGVFKRRALEICNSWLKIFSF